jgi:hypothetical protein
MARAKKPAATPPGPGAPGCRSERTDEVERKNRSTHQKVTAVKPHHQASGRPTPRSLSPPRPRPEERAGKKELDVEADAVLSRVEEEMLRLEYELARLK